MYESDNRAFTGTDQIGAEFAEREALLFAGLWRLALNATIPTIFRTDSSTTADQAAGRAGFATVHPTHELLRGTCQALQAGMSPDELLIEHVRGHAGDVWNELVDFLAKTEASICGKLNYLRHQMIAHGLNVLGVQEARSPPGLSMADQVLRISGGSDHGKFGVELWISLRQPYATIASKAQYFARSHFQLLHHDPRRLLVRAACAHFHGFFLVLHAPQSGRPFPERETWWEATTELVHKYCATFPIYVLMDANAKTGRFCEPIVFHQDDCESGSAPLLREFLITHGLCLPCASDVHTGDQATWTAPNGTDEHRIDFVALPQSALPRCTWSSTVSSLDPGHAHLDHVAVALQLEWQEQCSTQSSRDAKMRHDRHKIRDNHAGIDFSAIHVSSWHEDIEEHVTQLNATLHHGACPVTSQGPKKPFIDSATWTLRAEKLQLRRRLKLTGRRRNYDILAHVFRAWSSVPANAGSDSSWTAEHWNHQTTVLCSELCLVSRYWTTSRQLRQALQKARSRALTQTIQETGSEAATILHALRPFIGSTTPKKQKKACLPIVKQHNGALCQTPEEAQNRWIEHFRDMEGGTRMSHDDYRRHWRNGLSSFIDRAVVDFSVQELPSLFDLEVAFRRVPLGKALGLDDIPPELCHYCPAQLAKLTYAILMKAVLFGQEAIEHKGVFEIVTLIAHYLYPAISARLYTVPCAKSTIICTMLTCSVNN
eukprot:s1600_g18.t1